MNYLQRIYRTDAQRLSDTHYSNARQDNGDAISERKLMWNLQVMRETIEEQRQDRIENAYWRLREQMQQGVPGGEEIWSIARVGYELAAQDKKNGNVEKASVYSAMASLAATKFEAARKMAVSA